METCHHPPPGVAPRPCPAPAAPALLFVSLLAGAAAQPVASENPAQVCREPGSTRSGRRKKTRSCSGASASAQRRPPRISPTPPAPARAPALTNVSILIVVLFQLHVQQDLPSHHLHVSSRPSLGCSRLRSAPLGSGRKLRSALSALARRAPPAHRFSRRCSASD